MNTKRVVTWENRRKKETCRAKKTIDTGRRERHEEYAQRKMVEEGTV